MDRGREDAILRLADDLGRFLAGEPVQARGASTLYRFGKWIRRHRSVVAIAAAAVVLSLLLGGLWLRTRWVAGETALQAHRMGLVVERIERIIRQARALPLHDISREKAIVLQMLDDIEHELADRQLRARGPGELTLGRGNLVLGRLEAAQEHLQRAWQLGYREPAVAEALGRLYGELYLRAMAAADRIGDQQVRASRVAQIEQRLRRPALQYLELSRRGSAPSTAYVEGLISLYRRDLRSALAKARMAQEEEPWSHEGLRLEGQVHLAQAREAAEQYQRQEQIRSLARAAEVFDRAIAMAGSDSMLYSSACQVTALQIATEWMSEQMPAGLLERARRLCAAAVAADPGYGMPYFNACDTHRAVGEYRLAEGQDPTPELELARAVFARGEAVMPPTAGALQERARVEMVAAEWALGRGSPGQHLDAAGRLLARAEELTPGDPTVHCTWARLSLLRARWLAASAQEPDTEIDTGLQRLARALELNPNLADAYHLRSQLCRLATGHAESPAERSRLRELAEEAASLAAQINPLLLRP